MSSVPQKLNDTMKQLSVIRHLTLGDAFLCKVFLDSLDGKIAVSLMQSLLTRRTPPIFCATKAIRNPIHLKWIESRFLLEMGEKDLPEINFECLITKELREMTSKSVIDFLAAVVDYGNGRTATEQKVVNLATAFLKLSKEIPAITSTFLPKFSQVFSVISLAKWFSMFSFSSFNLYSSIEKIDDLTAYSYTYTNSRDYEELFQIPSGYLHDGPFVSIQNQVVSDQLYPMSVPYEVDCKKRSLIETSLLSKNHFVDIIRILAKRQFESGNYQKCFEHAKEAAELTPWIIASCCKDFSNAFAPVWEKVANLSGNTIIHDFIRRMSNDRSFFTSFKAYTGKILEANDLNHRSFPSYALGFVENWDSKPFQIFDANPLFCISDEQRIQDCDFMWSWIVILVIMKSIRTEKADKELISHIERCLSRIHKREARQCLISDCFSLIFLKKDGKFVCGTSFANSILTIILNWSNNQDLIERTQVGHFRMQVGLMLDVNGTMEDIMRPKSDLLMTALTKGDWQVANYIAQNDKHMLDLISDYKSVHGYRSREVEDISQMSMHVLIQLYLSSGEHELEPVAENLQPEIQNEVKAVLEKRMMSKDHMKVFETLDDETMQKINTVLKNLNSTKWNWDPWECDLHLSRFMTRLNSIITSLLENGMAITVADALSMKTHNNIDKLLRLGKTKDAEELANMLNIDIRNIVLFNETYSHELVEEFCRDMPVVAVASAVSTKEGKSTVTGANTICKKLLELRKCDMSMMDRICGIETEDDHTKTGSSVNSSETWDAILNAYYEQAFDDLIELSFTVDCDEFSDFLIQKSTNSNFEQILRIIEECAITPEAYDALTCMKAVKGDVENLFPLEKCLESLINMGKYDMASEFAVKIMPWINCIPVVKRCMEKGGDSDQIAAILAKVGGCKLDDKQRRRSLVNKLFMETIPPAWKAPCPPEVILEQRMDDDFDSVIDTLREFETIDCDAVFIESLSQSSISIEEMMSRIRKFIPVCRNQTRLVEGLEAIFANEISQVIVDNPETEFSLFVYLSHVVCIMRRFGDSEFLCKMEILGSIVERWPMTLFGKEYSMEGLGSKLIELCMFLDLPDIFEALATDCELPHYRKEKLYEIYFLKCCEMSIFDAPVCVPKNNRHMYRQLLDQFHYCHFYEPGMCEQLMQEFPPTEEMLMMGMEDCTPVLTHPKRTRMAMSLPAKHYLNSCSPPLMPPKLAGNTTSDDESTEDGEGHFYVRIRNLCRRAKAPGPSAASMELLRQIFFEEAPIDLVVRYHAMRNDFIRAICEVKAISDPEKRDKVFRDNILEVAIMNNRFRKLKMDMEGEHYLFNAILPVAGPHLRHEVEIQFGNYISACETALNLYRSTQNPSKLMHYLDMAQLSIEKSPVQGQKEASLLADISLQRLVNAIVISRKLPGFKDINLFGSDASKREVVMMLLINSEFDMALMIARTYHMTGSQMGGELVNRIMNEGYTRVITFIKELEIECSKNNLRVLFKEITYSIVMRVSFGLNHRDLLLKIIRAIEDPDFKSRLFIQFDVLEDAALIVIEHNLRDLAPLILVCAAQRNIKFAALAKCAKLLNE